MSIAFLYMSVFYIGVYFITLSYHWKFFLWHTDTELTPDDPEWIGAWWLGSLCLCIAMLFVTLPLLAFPRNLTGEEGEEKEKRSGINFIRI